MSTTKKEKTNFLPLVVMQPCHKSYNIKISHKTSSTWEKVVATKGMNKQNKETFMSSSQGPMATGGGFLNNGKEKIWTRSWPHEHQSWTPPFPPPGVGVSKRCTNKDLAYSTRDLYMKNWPLRVDLNPIKWTILWPRSIKKKIIFYFSCF